MATNKNNNKSKHTLWLPDELWHSIPNKNKTQYIVNAIQNAIQKPYNSHTTQQPIIDTLQQQIDELKRDKDYFKYLALPFWKRWKLKRLMPPQEK